MMIRLLLILIYIILFIPFTSCGSDASDDHSADARLIEKTVERAKADARAILATDTATMQREDAILRTHIVADRLRCAGDSALADLYFNTVRKIVEDDR